MSFTEYLKKGWEVVTLKTEAIDTLSGDEKAFGPALGIVAISGACWAIGARQPWGILYMPILRLIGFFIFVGITHFVATTFMGGSGEFRRLFTPVACALLVTWVAIIPWLGVPLGILAGLWVLVPAVLTAERVYGIDRGKAVVAVLTPIIIFIVLGTIFAIIGLSMWAAFSH